MVALAEAGSRATLSSVAHGSMETLSEAVDRLSNAGYPDDFHAMPDGLRDRETGRIHAPESLVIENVLRFEGESDPADESVVFALSSPTQDLRGTYVVVYGPGIGALDAQMVRRLTDGRDRVR